ncbi:MAG: tetratricopeptide repeat protein [Planctomycetes bacterium]|nr:tetratricopeptide repeat protein [Planctomycetota bacterium]MBL7142660.1 tetratricopeptide repeat protein [Phycisphaerae bacterium]
MKTIRNIVLAVVIVLVLSTVLYGVVASSTRRIQQGAKMPEFSTVDTAGKPFAYRRSGSQVLMLTFLSSQQKRSQEAIEDIFSILSGIPADKLTSLQVAFVMQNVDNREFIASIQKDAPVVVQIIGDEQYKIWGKFGVIATPTVVISDPLGKVLCVKPGHAYDFAPVVKLRLFLALDIPLDVSPDEASAVRTVANSTMSAKAKRHLQMAELLSKKGRVSSAIEQAQMAYEIDPNSAEVAVELGELLCQAGQAQEAIKLVSFLSGQSDRDKARINLIMGWAKRQLDQLEEAEEFLQEGIKQDPTSPRLRFELGRIYQKCNDSERAMQTYFRALQLIYPEEST